MNQISHVDFHTTYRFLHNKNPDKIKIIASISFYKGGIKEGIENNHRKFFESAPLNKRELTSELLLKYLTEWLEICKNEK